jgi:hypothetical protein
MKQFTLVLFAFILLSACGNNSSSGGKELIGKISAPAGTSFERKDFEGMGTIELPAGPGWQKEGNSWYNEKLDMTIVIQSHTSEDMSKMTNAYLNSYNDVNKRDAPNWKRGNEQPGTINGMPGARTEGSFNNGTPYVVRDYLFFAPNRTAIIQCRIAEKNKEQLAGMIDYIARSFQK